MNRSLRIQAVGILGRGNSLCKGVRLHDMLGNSVIMKDVWGRGCGRKEMRLRR